jgi:hypothetical protein
LAKWVTHVRLLGMQVYDSAPRKSVRGIRGNGDQMRRNELAAFLGVLA